MDVDMSVHSQVVNNTTMTQHNMLQSNLQVNNQLNASVTNVYTDEAQQLLTLQVTAAAAATVAKLKRRRNSSCLRLRALCNINRHSFPSSLKPHKTQTCRLSN